MPARSIGEILGTTDELGSIAVASRRVAQMQRVYLEAVPRDLSRSSRIGWARGAVLTVCADNGAVAAKLRQLGPRILKYLRQSGFEFNSMRIDVQVGQALGPAAYSPDKPLSKHALSAIEGTLDRIDDSPLRVALARLARHR
jgi:hypothetical protein